MRKHDTDVETHFSSGPSRICFISPTGLHDTIHDRAIWLQGQLRTGSRVSNYLRLLLSLTVSRFILGIPMQLSDLRTLRSSNGP